MTKTLTILRHAEAEWSYDDSLLTEKGRLQALSTGLNLRHNLPFIDRVFYSGGNVDIKRTRQTAKILIASYNGALVDFNRINQEKVSPQKSILESKDWLQEDRDYQEGLKTLPPEFSSVVLITHAPAIPHLLSCILPQKRNWRGHWVKQDFNHLLKTISQNAHAAILTFEIDDWKDLSKAAALNYQICRPDITNVQKIDPSLIQHLKELSP